MKEKALCCARRRRCCPGGRAAAAIAACLAAVAAARPAAALGPENVLVVVNEDSWASLAVANEYVALRRIPPANVVYLRLGRLYDIGSVSVDEFRQKILLPVLATMQRRKLVGQIDCIAYSSDLPYAVGVASDIGDRKLPKTITRAASVNGLTYLYRWVLAKDVTYLAMNCNFYGRRARWRPATRPATRPGPDLVERARAGLLVGRAKWDEAAAAYRKLLARDPRDGQLHYELSACLARLGKTDEAIAELGRAVDCGFADLGKVRGNEGLRALEVRKDFRAVVDRIAREHLELMPPAAFRAGRVWGPSGLAALPGRGQAYMLSTMLAVTSGRGNSLAEVRSYLARAAAADGTRPKGTIYYMANANIRSKVRQWGFAAAVARLADLGVQAEVVPGTLPTRRRDVMGLMAGTAGFSWPASGSTILPGAICEHLTSAGGVMRERGGQTPLTELLRYGAAAASGTVTEPYAIQAKFPTPFLHCFYAAGYTLAEAFYQSVHGPYQLLIVGDPLCRPWANIPAVAVDGLEAGRTCRGEISFTPRAAVAGGGKLQPLEVYVNGRRIGTAAAGEVLRLASGKLPDGHHELRVIATTADAVESQGRAIVPFEVDNHGRRVSVKGPAGGKVVLGEKAAFDVSLPGAASIALLHNGRDLATVTGAKGAAELDSARLGLGRVQVQAVAAVVDEGNTVYVPGRPVELQIVAPAPLPALAAVPDGLGKGLLLRPGDRPAVVIKDMIGRQALTSNGVKKGDSFELEGYFEAPADGLYQFQVNFHGRLTLDVDGKVLDEPPGVSWRLYPVALAKGWHRLRAAGTVTGSSGLNICFGGAGTASLSDRTFHCAAGS